MLRFAASLHCLFNELPCEERFAAAAACGLRAVEAQVPFACPAERRASLLRENGLAMALIDKPPGDWDAGERGLAAIPGREAEFREGVARARAWDRRRPGGSAEPCAS